MLIDAQIIFVSVCILIVLILTCANTEALPIPVHPATHPLVKFKHDYVGETHTNFSKVFEFVRSGGLRPELHQQTIASDSEQHMTNPSYRSSSREPSLV